MKNIPKGYLLPRAVCNEKSTLAIGAIFHNEAPYLQEWIEFHLEVGVTFFFLLNNLSTDNYEKVLKPYQRYIRVFSWPLEHENVHDWDLIQKLGLERILHFARGKVKWLALLDTDEFLFPTQSENLLNVLAEFEEYGGVGVNWQVFGTSNVSKIPKGELLIETLHLKLAEEEGVNCTIKSIVRPERVERCDSVHHMVYKPGYFQVNTDHLPFSGHRSPYVQIDRLRINHYRARDEHFFQTQKLERIHKWWNSHPKESWKKVYQDFNQVSDKTIFRFAPRIRERLAK